MKNLKNRTYQALRWSEKYTRTDMVYLARGGFWVSFGQGASSVLSLFLVIAFANLLPKETYGMYRYILSLAGILNIFTLTGMNNAVSRAVATGNEGALKTSVRYQFKWNLIMLAAFWVMSGYYFINGDSLFTTSFLILGIFVPFTLALNTYGSYLEGKRNFKLASISSFVSTIVYTVGILMAIIFSGQVIWLIVAYTITTFISTLFFYVYTIQKFKPTTTNSEDTLKYGRELTFIGFIGPISSQIDKIILTHFWGPAQLAIYTLALAVPERATSLIKTLVGVGFPKFSIKTTREINSTFYKRIMQGILFGLFTAVAYSALVPFIFKYILPQYIESILFSQILAISFLFAIPNRYVSLLLVSQKFTKPIFVNSMIQNLVKLCLYTLMGLWGGVLGLVWANVIQNFIGMLINIFTWRKASFSPSS